MKLNIDIKNRKYGRNNFSYFTVQSITLIRIPLSIIFSLVLLSNKNSDLIIMLSISLLLAIEATDLFDGIIARRYRVVSELGAALDPYADSITRLIVYWALAYKNFVIFLVPLSMAIRDVTVAYSRIMLAKSNRSVSARLSGKIKAWVQAIGAILALIGPYYWSYIGFWSYYALSWIIILATFFSAVEYVRDALFSLRAKR